MPVKFEISLGRRRTEEDIISSLNNWTLTLERIIMHIGIQMVLVPFATKNLALCENQVKCLVYHKKYLIPDIWHWLEKLIAKITSK